jgi:hypothetical protein
MKQMERYRIPRGAQMWECPLYQPDILAAAYAVRAYCEAYRLWGHGELLHHARYWAFSGLPFLYLWEMEGYPTMRYNVISVIGSTFHTHSWLGLPVVWCGLVYAYALLDLQELDDSFPWETIARGIVRSAMWQQYASGPSRGCYPDSWDMVENRPRPADINPENILVNGFRLRGRSPEIRSARLGRGDGAILLNSAADIRELGGSVAEGSVSFRLESDAGFPAYTLLAPVPRPREIRGSGEKVGGSEALQKVPRGWFYDAELKAAVLKQTFGREGLPHEVRW